MNPNLEGNTRRKISYYKLKLCKLFYMLKFRYKIYKRMNRGNMEEKRRWYGCKSDIYKIVI